MPTIQQLPAAADVSAADLIPLSQNGTTKATSVGALLATTQPAILLDRESLLGRVSIGSGSPEGIAVGTGLTFNTGTLVADGADHAGFQVAGSLEIDAELVISQQNTPMLMPATLLRGIFSAGENITIDNNGTISATGSSGTSINPGSDASISSLPALSSLSAEDLLIASHNGSNFAVSYGNLIDGVTIDQAQTAQAASDTDMIWVGQGGNTLAAQSFTAIWSWLTSKYPTYKAPILEITNSTTLISATHNNRLLICSQPVTLTPSVSSMGNGFQCNLLNVSSGNVTLGNGFVSSTGNTTLAPWQSATVFCGSYSGGSIVFAAVSAASATSVSAPGPASGLTLSAITSTGMTVFWLAPTSGGAASAYIVQFRVSGTSAWTSSSAITGASFQIAGLQAGTAYDVAIQAINGSGGGPLSPIVTGSTSAPATSTPVVTGLTASAASSSSIQLTWSASGGAAQSFTVQYRLAGNSDWTSTISGLTGLSATVTGLSASASYEFVVFGINGSGSGAASNIATAATSAPAQSVTMITWNVGPSSSYARSSGSIGLNVHVSPPNGAVQFGLSSSATTPPTAWTAATYVNTDLWGVYLQTPATPGTWYAWVEGQDGSATSVSSPFTVT
jgi:hypothetical protein